MKKISIVSLALLAFMANSAVCNASDGKITFTGKVIAEGCDVDTADQNKSVALGTVAATQFAAAGDKSPLIPFTLKLSECPEAVTKVAIRFDGTPNSTNAKLLALDADQTATGLGIEISDDAGTAIDLATNSKTYTVDTTAELKFGARYVSTGTVGAGTANGTSQFTVIYQ
ncbi:fimbrial protein [Franconibacter pulveris 601]|uniref:fimbrial protein n=1 Tax=Franconibacter pulveris TaxID=435910 RepID=UPI0004643571|nr:fimbrial protein [Franconibacter pulveris]